MSAHQLSAAQIQERDEQRHRTSNAVHGAARVAREKIRDALREFEDVTGLRAAGIEVTHLNGYQINLKLKVEL